MKTPHWTLHSGLEFCFGRGATQQLQRIAKQQHWNRFFIVTDPNLVAAGVVEIVTNIIQDAGAEFEVYANSTVEPSSDHASEALDLAHRFQPDAWIGLGGGSNMDLAKMCAAAYACEQPPSSLFGWNQVPQQTLPLVCIPTTAGSGSECSHAAIIKNSETGHKTPILSQSVRPKFAIVDPNLGDSCPAHVAAESGMDALTHAIEALLTTEQDRFDGSGEPLPYEGNHLFGTMYAERAIELIGRHLEDAVLSPKDSCSAEAREGMALAASLAGMAFSNCGVALCHAIEYWVGDRYPCSHGIGNAILLPEVMRFQLPARAEKLSRIGELLGVAADPEAAIEEVASLRNRLQLPNRLSEVGAQEADLKAIAESSFKLERLVALTPVPTQVEDLEQILRACL